MHRVHRLPMFLALLAVLLLEAGCDIGRKYQAALLLGDIAAGEETSLLKRTTPEPLRKPVDFAIGTRGERMQGDLYISPEGSLAGLLLVPGAAEEGRDDPRLVAFARSLARARFLVLVPEMPSLRRLQVNVGNIEEVADAFFWLVSRPELAPDYRAGMAAFSYAAGPAVLAAMKSRLRSRVKFLLTVGGYYDLREVLVFFTTGYYQRKGEWCYRRPNAYGKWVFVLGNVHRLDKEKDRRLLAEMARRKLENIGASIDDLASRLSPQGRRVYAFVVNKDPEQAPGLMARLPESILRVIRAVNPSVRDMDRLRARMLLVHGIEDPIIPYTQSVVFDRALPEEQARLFLVRGLTHVDIRPGWLGRWKLWRATEALLEQRDP